MRLFCAGAPGRPQKKRRSDDEEGGDGGIGSDADADDAFSDVLDGTMFDLRVESGGETAVFPLRVERVSVVVYAGVVARVEPGVRLFPVRQALALGISGRTPPRWGIVAHIGTQQGVVERLEAAETTDLFGRFPTPGLALRATRLHTGPGAFLIHTDWLGVEAAQDTNYAIEVVYWEAPLAALCAHIGIGCAPQ